MPSRGGIHNTGCLAPTNINYGHVFTDLFSWPNLSIRLHDAIYGEVFGHNWLKS